MLPYFNVMLEMTAALLCSIQPGNKADTMDGGAKKCIDEQLFRMLDAQVPHSRDLTPLDSLRGQKFIVV